MRLVLWLFLVLVQHGTGILIICLRFWRYPVIISSCLPSFVIFPLIIKHSLDCYGVSPFPGSSRTLSIIMSFSLLCLYCCNHDSSYLHIGCLSEWTEPLYGTLQFHPHMMPRRLLSCPQCVCTTDKYLFLILTACQIWRKTRMFSSHAG